MFFFYQIIITVLLITSPIIIIYRLIKQKENKERFKEKFSFTRKKRKKGKLIWFHGASVGEIMSIIPLIKNYEKNKSVNQILITSCTLSSSKIIEKFNFKKTTHQFYPIDYFFFTNNFLKYWKPSLAIFIESEIWPSMFKNLKHKKIPLILLNARLTEKTFNRWMKIRYISKKIFKKITVAFPQNLETKFFLKKLNVKKINFIGNLKFAKNYDENLVKLNNRLQNQFDKKKIWVASSTHKNEEILCAKAHIELKKKVKNLITIIIPRHIHRVEEIIDELKNENLNIALHSTNIKNLSKIDIYIVDTFGETEKFHKIASSVFLGGSIIKRGGQNPLEAARFGANIIHGPNVDNFKDVYKFLKSLKVSNKVNTVRQLVSSIKFKKNKIASIKIKKIGEKILKKTIKQLDNLINNELKKT
tara:strand:+ start:1083 stop:2333 length:1251 start_codon:yes stop_codon:yes gene_type:complete